jgi:hypothetical protein
MIKVKTVESKITPEKKNIIISDVKIDGDKLVDEEGSIAQRLLDEVDGLADTFTLKITLELPEEEVGSEE